MNKSEVPGVFLDLKMAFDLADHDILLKTKQQQQKLIIYLVKTRVVYRFVVVAAVVVVVVKGKLTKTMSKTSTFKRERRAEGESNQGPSA